MQTFGTVRFTFDAPGDEKDKPKGATSSAKFEKKSRTTKVSVEKLA